MSSSNDAHKRVQRALEDNIGDLADTNHKSVQDPKQPSSQSSTYVPVQFSEDNGGQDPTIFYGSLIDQAGYPSEILCRMSDALFFYVDHNCPQSRGTRLIEPEKIFWENVALGHDLDVSEVVARQVSLLYDNAGIPYTRPQFNDTKSPVLDRRGYIRFRVFEIRANPEECHQVFKLRDPVTNLPFPTPIPRFAFPPYPDYERRNTFINWQTKAIADLMRKRALKTDDADTASPTSPSSNSSKSTEKRSKFSRLMGFGGKDEKDKDKDKKEEPEAVRKAAHEKKTAAVISVGATVVSTLINQFA
ncbi:hypothetical protein Clacol_001171 [Clathrus columnatus]|uniref:DUF7514 domain-containing protein n=1 Tax=Clathrus columnatus TaxID=1419009 RepID=A0AAV5A2W6_9AGAM|nr:hypothetical protein Clacol_001171 [Clathrus columnatus]